MNNSDTRNDGEGAVEVYSKAVRAGRRTYFFDVKATRNNDDFYIVVTESRRKTEKDGNVSYEKHKMHLYKEDFAKFSDGLNEVIAFIQQRLPEIEETPSDTESTRSSFDEEFDKL